MINKQTLKKHNLKAVPFEYIGGGDTFNIADDFGDNPINFPWYARRMVGGKIYWADGSLTTWDLTRLCNDYTVYVPVWRPCREVAK